MSEHCDPQVATDVYTVEALTASAVPDPLDPAKLIATLALSDTDLQFAYDNSCAPVDYTYQEFVDTATAQANAVANSLNTYNDAVAFNNNRITQPGSIRILRIRVCIDIGWLKIYINWHI